MLIRKNEYSHAHQNSEVWEDEVTQLLSSVYEKKLKERDLELKIYGLTFDDEAVLIVSLLSAKDPMRAPTTLFLAADLARPDEGPKATAKLINVSSLFLDLYFQKKEWSEYLDVWREEKEKDFTYFYKMNRENVGLTLEADRLLAE